MGGDRGLGESRLSGKLQSSVGDTTGFGSEEKGTKPAPGVLKKHMA